MGVSRGQFGLAVDIEERQCIDPCVEVYGPRLIAACDRADLPRPARKALNLLADQLIDTQKKISELTADIRADATANDAARRLQTIPGVGPITASAFVRSLPDVADFKSARDLSAWIGVRSVSRTDRVPARTAQAAFIGWQGTAREDFQDGQQVSASAALSRGNGPGQCAA